VGPASLGQPMTRLVGTDGGRSVRRRRGGFPPRPPQRRPLFRPRPSIVDPSEARVHPKRASRRCQSPPLAASYRGRGPRVPAAGRRGAQRAPSWAGRPEPRAGSPAPGRQARTRAPVGRRRTRRGRRAGGR